MGLEVCTIGGFSEIGGNSCAIKVDDEVIILDMGLHMENYIRYTEDEDIRKLTYEELRSVNAVPNYHLIDDWKGKVIGICPSHGHLDHIGAIPFSAGMFPGAPIVCTPYTAEVIKSILKDEKIKLSNKIVSINLNGKHKFSDKITVEFVNITHSIPHSSLIVVHTPYGKIVYAQDYKIDRSPTLGKKPNLKRIEEIGNTGEVKLAFIESLYAAEHMKTPSEMVAKQMLKDVMLGVHANDNLMLVTTFSSHLARLKSILQLGQELGREVIFIGRSLSKYIGAGEKIGIVNFSSQAKIVRQTRKSDVFLKRIKDKNRGKYLLVITGHQGEPKAVLSRLAREELKFKFKTGDLVIFSCSIIPTELNRELRADLERSLKNKGVRICKDIHVSGHAAREDHRQLLSLLKPEHIIPSHAGYEKAHHLAELAKEMGFKNIHMMADGKRLKLIE